MISSRDEIKDFILEIEDRFPVNEWSLNGFYFWPILRIRLFFYLIRQVEYQTKKETSNAKLPHKKRSGFAQKLAKLYAVFYTPFWWSRLPKKKHIFVAQDAHRVNYKGKRYNRFFDVLIKKYGLEQESMYFETSKIPSSHIEAGHLLYDYDKALQVFLRKKRIKSTNLTFENSSYRDFINTLESNEQTKGFIVNYTEKRLVKWYERKVVPKLDFFSKLLQKIQPQQLSILCYYSENNMLLIAAANALNVKTVEMQHGPQSPLHLCYASWNKVPVDGYQVLPREYWCWDKASKDTIDAWANSSSLYKAAVIGNPWVDLWKEIPATFSEENYILYSLQPKPVSLSQLFSENIIDLMKELGLPWFVRLHPRQLGELETIKTFLKNKGVSELVRIDEATQAALPQLLANAIIHVTHYSGTVIEASQMQTRTIILHPIGKQSFSALIEAGRAVYLNPENEDFIQQFTSVIRETTKNELPETRYSTVKDLF
ncbi:hypothetical protein G5B37_13915 [Rasiella rasia]|uniref:Uncharacterized protein n=1 Tax=Rasiella rasia TaxID=2744027 RepID=A0A6G6GPZ2_9FLAO|nr:hypothetical protein [Rasiella rasia]QIE60619.1 hypothetical protein G5B37_13915 [Rasiella rasia]